MIHHANARTVIVLDENEREAAVAALGEVVRMLDEITRRMDDPADPDRDELLRHEAALRSLLRAVEA